MCGEGIISIIGAAGVAGVAGPTGVTGSIRVAGVIGAGEGSGAGVFEDIGRIGLQDQRAAAGEHTEKHQHHISSQNGPLNV